MAALSIAIALATASCTVGPKYIKPSVPSAGAYKEQPPDVFKELAGWKAGDPKDDAKRGKWWEIFGDPQLNALEEQIDVNNQSLAQAEAQFRGARAAIKIARAAQFPTVTGGVAVTGSETSGNRGNSNFLPRATSDVQFPFSATWEADVWGRIRRTIEESIETAQASAGDLENVRLSMQALLALDYFQLHGLDQEKQLLDDTVKAYQKALDLTNNRYNQGVASQVDVVLAQTQLEQTRAQSTDTTVQRAQFEHAIAILIGKPPAALTIPVAPLTVAPPAIPVGLPSALLERRPDIAANERRVAAANAQIGVVKAAYYPTITLSASGGIEGSSLVNLFTWPSRFWSLGPSLVETLIDVGKRQGTVEQAQAFYDAAVAAYRENVLTAFQGVEDNLAALRIFEQEARQQADAVRFAERSLELANNRYQGGITTYLEVITAQATALTNERTAVQLLTRRMTASVALVEALGGDWNVGDLPAPGELAPWKSTRKAVGLVAPAPK